MTTMTEMTAQKNVRTTMAVVLNGKSRDVVCVSSRTASGGALEILVVVVVVGVVVVGGQVMFGLQGGRL